MDGSDGKLLYALILNGKAANKTAKHMDLYTKKKLLTRFDSLRDLAQWSYWNGSVTESTLRQVHRITPEFPLYPLIMASLIPLNNSLIMAQLPRPSSGTFSE